MNTTAKALLLILLLTPVSVAVAQREGTMHIGRYRSSADSDQLLKATDDQRAALAKCMEETERVRLVLGRMPRIGSIWSRGRLRYTTSDLSTLATLTEQLHGAIADLTATHEKFTKLLTDSQRRNSERRLRKLDRLQFKLKSTAAELDGELAKATPGPARPGIAWDVNSIEKTSGKWRSEHRKIAKEMGIGS